MAGSERRGRSDLSQDNERDHAGGGGDRRGDDAKRDERPLIDGHLRQPRQHQSRRRLDDVERRRAKDQAERRPGAGNHQAFGHRLARHAPAARAERDPDGDIAQAPDRARQEQAGEVDRGDEQHERDEARDQPQLRADAADDLVVKRPHDERAAAIGIGMRLRQPRAQRRRDRRRLFN